MDFDRNYYKSQVNGTIYVKTRLVLAKDQLESLELRAGELHLSGIPKNISPETIMKIASELGYIYSLRYKIDFSGDSRGFAYLQYLDESLKSEALINLPNIFAKNGMHIRVNSSLNVRELLLVRVEFFNPVQLYLEMRKLSPFIIMRVFEHKPMRFIYTFEYRNSDVAASAHRNLRNIIRLFGPEAYISWLHKYNPVSSTRGKYDCCQDLDAQLRLPDPSKCNCFKLLGSYGNFQWRKLLH